MGRVKKTKDTDWIEKSKIDLTESTPPVKKIEEVKPVVKEVPAADPIREVNNMVATNKKTCIEVDISEGEVVYIIIGKPSGKLKGLVSNIKTLVKDVRITEEGGK